MPLGEQGYANALFDLSGMALHSFGSDVGIGPSGMLHRPLFGMLIFPVWNAATAPGGLLSCGYHRSLDSLGMIGGPSLRPIIIWTPLITGGVLFDPSLLWALLTCERHTNDHQCASVRAPEVQQQRDQLPQWSGRPAHKASIHASARHIHPCKCKTHPRMHVERRTMSEATNY